METSSDPNRWATFADLLEQRAADRPDATYATFPDTSLTFAALRQRSANLARGLIAGGLAPGDHVAIMMPNCPEFLVAHFAVQLAGGTSVLLNARFKQHELGTVLAHCDARAVITTDAMDEHVDLARLILDALPGLVRDGGRVGAPTAPLLNSLILFGDRDFPPFEPVGRVEDRGAPVSDEALARARTGQDGERTSLLIYTSGSTAAPKACELSAATVQRSWRIYADAVKLAAGEKIWVPLPFFHCGGIGLATVSMARAASIVSSPHFQADDTAALLERERVDHLYPVFHALSVPLLRSPRYDRGRWTAFVKTMVSVGPLGTQQVLRDLLPAHVKTMNVFGMTESSGVLTVTRPEDPEDKRLGTCGRVQGDAEVTIRDPETLAVLPAGERGEIVFRGAGAVRGYYRDPVATAAAVLPGGWVRSGDLGMFDDDGWLHFLGRIKDMLKVGGENVAAAEVESFLSSHPAVKFVQVIGKPDERLGEVPVAFIERNAGAEASEDDIIAFCRGSIASYKVPRQVVFVTEWPMSATKVQKGRLKEMLPA
ncbi:MAG: acyl--CoA ligase [Rhizobiaceae bacterium]|nr:acyl--CoA ligase [Rhizobiaceae bacterium]